MGSLENADDELPALCVILKAHGEFRLHLFRPRRHEFALSQVRTLDTQVELGS